jgi:hypothetical protein
MAAVSLIMAWMSFILLVSLAEEVNLLAFLYVSSIILYITYYINNDFKNINMSLQVTIFFLTIPSSIYWYVFIQYNYFLRIKPFSYSSVVFIMFTYFYILMYIFFESHKPTKYGRFKVLQVVTDKMFKWQLFGFTNLIFVNN